MVVKLPTRQAMGDDVWNATPGLHSMFMKHNFL